MSEIVTAQDLLLKYLDYHCNWVQCNFSTARPAQFREQQLVAMLKAFGIVPSLDKTDNETESNDLVQTEKSSDNNSFRVWLNKIFSPKELRLTVSDEDDKLAHQRVENMKRIAILHYFTKNTFLAERDIKAYLPLMDQAIDVVRKELTSLNETDMRLPKHYEVRWLYGKLLSFRMEMYKVTYPWGGMLEGLSVGYWYSHILATEVQKQILPHLATIDQVLCQIIDSYDQEISMSDLMEKYEYPYVDLEDIDREWRIENW
ncbi:hypothetical protein QNI19_08855 [Cytophagaceae bacterium DM2B3-1]|uniref:DUF4272 domain-containing protein n=1 Tax=Xanthocytophaga flava TaxID=3048013 RepID=A0ABT7CJ72_9BACT|nr:hypothetical protein [Xanthocytophaga flavus]MDJ1493040.1 hypothetical protein [Xanthocytophaga flavus]